MMWLEFKTPATILRCAAVFAAHVICVGRLAAQDMVFRSFADGLQ